MWPSDIDLAGLRRFVQLFPSPCLIVYGGSLRIFTANQPALLLLGESCEHPSSDEIEPWIDKELIQLPKKIARLTEPEPHAWDTRIRRKDGMLMEVSVTTLLFNVSESTFVIVVMRDRSKEARQKRYSNLLLGTLAHTTRHDFFEYFSQSLARITNMGYVGVCRRIDEDSSQSLANIIDRKIKENFAFNNGGLPTEFEYNSTTLILNNKLQDDFPGLAPLGFGDASIFIGVQLIDTDGQVLGHIWAMDSDADHDSELIMETMRSYAPMVASELRRRSTEDDAERMQARLTQAQKLESLGVLAGGIAHDFNNLLTGIMGNVDLGLADLPEDNTARQNLYTIRQSAIRAADLCRQMLTYAGQGVKNNGPIELNRVVTEMVQLLEVSVSKNAALKLQLEDDLPVVSGDTSQLSQIVMNLITNASEALNAEGGTIHLTTGVKYCDSEFLAQSLISDHLRPGCYVYLEVDDDGSGMNEETVQRMFDPFYTTKFAGRGLGLSAVVGIVRAHGGALQLKTKPGVGTMIRILFPATELRVNHRASPVMISPDVLNNRTILVADDDKTVLATTKAILSSAGANVVVASDGVEMVELLNDLYSRTQTRVDLALVDLTMPRMDGMEAILAMRGIDPDIKAVLTSGYDEHDVTSQFDGDQQLNFLQKPYLSEQLIRNIDETLKLPATSSKMK